MRVLCQAVPAHGEGYLLECSGCGPVGATVHDENQVREAITNHMMDAHATSPEGFGERDLPNTIEFD